MALSSTATTSKRRSALSRSISGDRPGAQKLTVRHGQSVRSQVAARRRPRARAAAAGSSRRRATWTSKPSAASRSTAASSRGSGPATDTIVTS